MTDATSLSTLLERAALGRIVEVDGGICLAICPEDGGNVVCLAPERVMAASLARWPERSALIVAAVNVLPDHLETIAAQKRENVELRARVAAVEAEVAKLRHVIEAAWRDGWRELKNRLTDDEAFPITEDVEHDAWLDSEFYAALADRYGEEQLTA